MARTLEIAAVVGLNDVTKKVKDGDYIVFNGDTGEVIVNPDEETKAKYALLKKEFEEYRKSLELLKGQSSITTDGRHVELAGNIGSPNDVEGLIKNDAEGVGLYRTEFLYMDKEDGFPTEEEQYEAYKAVLEGMNNKPIVIRTLDIGGDKELPYFEMEPEMNPFLGYRAIRICLDRKDIFKTQLRALYRASIHGKLRIMFPMISSLEEGAEDGVEIDYTADGNIQDGMQVVCGGILSEVKKHLTKANKQEMAMVKLEDIYGVLNVMVFPKSYTYLKDKLVEDSLVTITGKISIRPGEAPIVVCDNVIPWEISEEKQEVVQKLYLRFDLTDTELYKKVCEVLTSYTGNSEIIVKCTTQNKPFKLGINTSINNFVLNQLNGLLGTANVVVK